MINNEKQIEEMTKDLKEDLRLCAGVKLLDHNVETIAYELSKKYQPKISEDSVVLSREEKDKTDKYITDLCSMIDNLRDDLKKASKETAEKLIKFVSELCDNETLIWQLDEFVKNTWG